MPFFEIEVMKKGKTASEKLKLYLESWRDAMMEVIRMQNYGEVEKVYSVKELTELSPMTPLEAVRYIANIKESLFYQTAEQAAWIHRVALDDCVRVAKRCLENGNYTKLGQEY